MLRAAERKKNGKRRAFIFRWLYRHLALIYYDAVREAGGSRSLGGFYFAEKKRCHDDLVREMDNEQKKNKNSKKEI